MIAYLRGTLRNREITGGPADKLVIEVAGVGFDVTATRSAAISLGDVGEEVLVHTALTIRETEWNIFGFASREEKEMFLLLQSVTGVGPKLALALVGHIGPDRIADAIESEDQKLLSQAPGVGTKVAQRIILELKSKIELFQAKRGVASNLPTGINASISEARAILEGLGYTLTEINMALKKVENEEMDDDVEQLVRHSLKVLGSGK
jgi:holliday junction DNA helicase RuvA